MEEHLLVNREPLDGAKPGNQDPFAPVASAGLFVGVSSFEDERIQAVPFAVDDAVDLAHLFTLELGLLLPERTVLLLAGEPRKPESIERLALLIERGARRHTARMRDIYRYLGELARWTEERGLFVLSVAAHGVSDQGGDFLVATDSLRERILLTGVSVTAVFDDVARAGAGCRLVLLDACRERLSNETRGVAESAMSQSFADAIACAKGSVVLSGATLGGFAYDDRTRQNGVFTAAILDGLRGEAPAGPEGWITVGTLADFVQQRVAEWVRRNRPEHAAKSLGIGRRVEATAEALPLAPHMEATRERQRLRERREKALVRVKENLGRVLSGAHWDQVATLLEEPLSSEVERLLEEIEALDGSERAQRSLRDFLRELSEKKATSLSPRPQEKRNKVVQAEMTKPSRLKIRQRSSPWAGWLAKNQLKFALVPIILLLLILFAVVPYLVWQESRGMRPVAPRSLQESRAMRPLVPKEPEAETKPELTSDFSGDLVKQTHSNSRNDRSLGQIGKDDKRMDLRATPTAADNLSSRATSSSPDAFYCNSWSLIISGETVLTDDKTRFPILGVNLTPEAAADLAILAEELLKDNKIQKIEIQGHTDSLESLNDNCQLGMRRAKAVRLFLALKGVPLEKMIPLSYGDSAPVGDNATSEGRTQNRRVAVLAHH